MPDPSDKLQGSQCGLKQSEGKVMGFEKQFEAVKEEGGCAQGYRSSRDFVFYSE